MAYTQEQSALEELTDLSAYLQRFNAARRSRLTSSRASNSTAVPIKLEEAQPAGISAVVPAKKPRKKAAANAAKASSSNTLIPTTQNRISKPSSRTPTGTQIGNKRLRLIAEAPVRAASAAAAGEPRNRNDNDNTANSTKLTVAALSAPKKPVPPPQPAADVFPVLPDDANPIDRAIFERLALVWDEESGRWTRAMQQSVLDTLPRARVTRSTANFGNHYLSRAAREGSQAVTWGQFIALRAMFGPAVCFRYEWAGRLAERYPLAREDAYEGVIPDKVTVQDVLDGKAGMPVARRRKVSIMTLAPERSRKRGPTWKRKANAEAEAEREDWLADLKREESMAAEEGGEDEVGKVGEDVWNEAAASAGRMDPAAAIAKMKEKYRAQEAEVKRLRASNDGIRRALMAFTNMAAMAQKT